MTVKYHPHSFYLLFSILYLLSSILLNSCNPQKKAIKSPIREEGADYLFGKLKENELKYDWFTAKFSANYTNKGESNSFNGQLRIRHDSVIWLSFSPMLGIEVFRMIMTTDSVKFVNRINDTYFIGNYDSVNKFLGTNIDFDILQSFLIGNDLSFYENGKFKASLDNDQYKLSTAERSKLRKFVKNSQGPLNILIQNLWIDPSTFKITRADVKEIRKQNLKLEALYSDFEKVEGQLIPEKLNFVIFAEKNIRVAVEFTRITINSPQTFPFKIPSGFRQVH